MRISAIRKRRENICVRMESQSHIDSLSAYPSAMCLTTITTRPLLAGITDLFAWERKASSSATRHTRALGNRSSRRGRLRSQNWVRLDHWSVNRSPCNLLVMSEINRSLIVVMPKQPFLDWLLSVDPDHQLDLEEISDDPTAYLIPECGTDEEREQIIDWCADFLFEQELWSWYTDEDLWPVRRDAQTFREWFEVKFHSLVFDVVGDIPLQHVEYGDDDSSPDPSSNGH